MSSQLAMAATPADHRAPPIVRHTPVPVCRHCAGSGREPAPLLIEFSRSGDLRGEQQRMSDETGISPAMLSMIIAGQRTPSVLSLIRIARYCRTTVDRVLRIQAIWQRVHSEQADSKQ